MISDEASIEVIDNNKIVIANTYASNARAIIFYNIDTDAYYLKMCNEPTFRINEQTCIHLVLYMEHGVFYPYVLNGIRENEYCITKGLKKLYVYQNTNPQLYDVLKFLEEHGWTHPIVEEWLKTHNTLLK